MKKGGDTSTSATSSIEKAPRAGPDCPPLKRAYLPSNRKDCLLFWFIPITGTAAPDIAANPTVDRTATELRDEVSARFNDGGTARPTPIPKPSITPANAREAVVQRANFARTKGHPEHARPRVSADGRTIIIQSPTKPADDAAGPFTAAQAGEQIKSNPQTWENPFER
jgi:hypothetical protein